MIRLTLKPQYKKDDVTQWKDQSVNISTNQKVKVNFFLPDSSAPKIVMWKYYEDDYDKNG